MKKNLDEIHTGPWFEDHGENKFSVEPSPEEIEKAIAENIFETRGFQENIIALTDEWNKEAGLDFDKYLYLRRQYHARRIAYFVVHPSSDPIILDKETGGVKEGLHRLKAAKHRGAKSVCVRFE
jgi:hypothetical protein